MTTSVVETSIEAYNNLKSDGKLNERQRQVMAAITEGRDYSLQELVMRTGLPINVVSGRVSELKKSPLNRLEHGPKRKCSITQNTIQPVRLADKQKPLFALADL